MTEPELKQGSIIAVTGANGFLASYVVKALLERGYTARAIVRGKTDPAKVDHLKVMAEAGPGKLELWDGDLLEPGSYDAAFVGAHAVIHIATAARMDHTVSDVMKEIVEPSIQGTTNALNSALKSQDTIKRFLYTSTAGTIIDMDKPDDFVFDESSWNDWATPTNGAGYHYGKVQAERLVSSFYSEHKTKFDFAVVNPTWVLGPCLTRSHSKASPVLIRNLLYNNEHTQFCLNIADVRDVADCHIKVLEREACKGQRYICCGPYKTHAHRVTDYVHILAELFPDLYIVPNVMPSWKYWMARLLWQLSDFQIKGLARFTQFDSSRSVRELGMVYRPLKETIKDTATSLIDNGWVKVTQRK